MWIVNCVFVHSATRALVERVARLPSVSFVRGNNVAGRIDPVPRARIGLPRVQLEKALQWNILKIEADVAWNVTRGAGVTVAGIDTGVRYTHESLLASYRGYNGTDVAEHNYNWFDPKEFANDPCTHVVYICDDVAALLHAFSLLLLAILVLYFLLTLSVGWCIPGVCSPWECCAEFPFDNNGHGTHTMGTIAGSEDFGIGVAPGVKWIAAKGCRDGSCLDYGLTRSAQWVICPTDLENDNEDCSVGADIVSNSWGSGGGDIFYHDWTRAWLEAGILPVFSNGNEGPRCETAGSPADHEGVVGVGATDEDDVLADFSSRGPGVGGDGFSVARPNVAAPGVDIYSATSLTGSYDDAKYSEKSGTSMACPHVTGVAALILSVNPQLTVEQLTSILETTADQGMPAPDNGRTGSDECGGVHYTTYPNYHYGQGRVNARKAVEAAMLTLKQ